MTLNFSGKIIDHLGIQMYQSPIAAIAEMVSNSWDADAHEVKITLPSAMNENSEIIISDNGNGMTIEECQNRYLTTGYDTRKGDPRARSRGGRFLMGRKGIGKFAGFGISKKITVSTVSRETGEKTSFTMDLDKIRSDEYIGRPIALDSCEHTGPNPEQIPNAGTTILLQTLNINRTPSIGVFLRGLAKRFLINKNIDTFVVKVNDEETNDDDGLDKAEYVFPRDYTDDERPTSLEILENNWGRETLPDGNVIKWRFLFYPDIISEDDLKGISVFANKKIAQNPFLFNLTTNQLPTTTGPEYLTGRIEADFIDRFSSDVISTERQRINWEHRDTQSLFEWGQERVKQILSIRKKRRNEKLESIMVSKLSPFNTRILKLQAHEQKIIYSALKKLATINKITPDEFENIGNAILTAWEGGRLKELIFRLSQLEEINDEEFLGILMETKVLNALHTAEAVKSKLDIITGFEKIIVDRDKENSIRDFIAENPWLISAKWDTFRKEVKVTNLLKEAAAEAKMDDLEDFKKRIDLVLSSGNQLLILEFMRPKIPLNSDHIFRFEMYVRIVRNKLRANTALGFSESQIYGYLVADSLSKAGHFVDKITSLKQENMFCIDWLTLLEESKAQWKDFLIILQERAPDDDRLKELVADETV